MNTKEMKEHIVTLGDRINVLTGQLNQAQSELNAVKSEAYDSIIECQKREKQTHQTSMGFYNALAQMLGVEPENNTLNLDRLLSEVEQLKKGESEE